MPGDWKRAPAALLGPTVAAAKHGASQRTAQWLANVARTPTTPEELAEYQILAYNRLAEPVTSPTRSTRPCTGA